MQTLEGKGSLIYYVDAEGVNRCLGSLLYSAGHGTYEPSLGRVSVTEEEAKIHNACLDTALLEGLDKKCEVKQGGTFYVRGTDVVTFTGTLVSRDCSAVGRSLTFRRKGKTYRGRMSKQYNCFNFRRIK